MRNQIAYENAVATFPADRRLHTGTDGTVASPDSRIRRLIDNGFLPNSAGLWEDKNGRPRFLSVRPGAPDPSLPPFLQTFEGYHVWTDVPETDLDALRQDRKTWEEIWNSL